MLNIILRQNKIVFKLKSFYILIRANQKWFWKIGRRSEWAGSKRRIQRGELNFCWPGVDFVKTFAPRPGAKCAGNNVFCFIKKNSTPCASPREYLRHTPNAMRHAPCAMRHAPNFYEEIAYLLRSAPVIFAPCALRRKKLRYLRRAQNWIRAMRRAPNFYEINPWSSRHSSMVSTSACYQVGPRFKSRKNN